MLPAWNDTENKKMLIDFVARVTEGGHILFRLLNVLQFLSRK